MRETRKENKEKRSWTPQLSKKEEEKRRYRGKK